MKQEIPIGAKVRYWIPGNPTWLTGTVHGVKRKEDPATNFILELTYLIDTGANTRIDKYPFDHRDREVTKRIRSLMKDGKDYLEAAHEVVKHTDLPESRLDVVVVRQPEQVEVLPKNLRRI